MTAPIRVRVSVFLEVILGDGDHVAGAQVLFHGVLIDEVAYSGDVDILGDVDGDGLVTMADAVIAARHAMGIITLSDEAFAIADMDKDGFVTMIDAVLIMRIAAIQE